MYKIIFFDLDNTIYPADSGLWEAIGGRINLFMSIKLGVKDEDLIPLRKYCRINFGTTMKGLKELYQFDEEEYLDYVHDIDLHQYLNPDSRYKHLFASYDLRKAVFTSADKKHANRILDFYGINHFFERVIDIHDTSPYVKPQQEAFLKALDLSEIMSPKECVFIDDQFDNIIQAKELGFWAIYVNPHNFDNYPDCIPTILDLPSILTPHSNNKVN